MTDLTQIITYSQPSTGHGFFRCSVSTARHLDYTKHRLAIEHPGAQLVIIQGCYHTGVGVSEGTHDKDRCLDVRIIGLTWAEAQWFLRRCGWAAWHRIPSQGPWTDHVHMVSLVHPALGLPVGEFVPGQIIDYYLHTFGLAGMHNVDQDKSRFPGDDGPAPWPVGTPTQWRDDINATLDDFYKWERELEDSMGFRDSIADPADKAAFVALVSEVVKGVVNEALKAVPTKVWAFVVRHKDGAIPALTARAAVRETREKVD